MDGCYIDDNKIYFSKDDLSFRYEDDGIYTNRVEDAKKRNKIKSTNLNIIHSLSIIFGLKLETYYFSCNLDHVLHNKRNLKQNLKEDYADEFADQYEGKEEEFVDFVNDKALCIAYNYEDSWNKIKEDNHSLLKYTNLKTFFDNNVEFLKEEVKTKVISYQKISS